MSRRAVRAPDEAGAEGARYYWGRKVYTKSRLDSAPVARFARFCLLERGAWRGWRQADALEGRHCRCLQLCRWVQVLQGLFLNSARPQHLQLL